MRLILSISAAVLTGHPTICVAISSVFSLVSFWYVAPGNWVAAGAAFVLIAVSVFLAHYGFTLHLWGLEYKLWQADRLNTRHKIGPETCSEMKENACNEHRRSQVMKAARHRQRLELIDIALKDYFSNLIKMNKSDAMVDLNKNIRAASRRSSQ